MGDKDVSGISAERVSGDLTQAIDDLGIGALEGLNSTKSLSGDPGLPLGLLQEKLNQIDAAVCAICDAFGLPRPPRSG